MRPKPNRRGLFIAEESSLDTRAHNLIYSVPLTADASSKKRDLLFEQQIWRGEDAMLSNKELKIENFGVTSGFRNFMIVK
jgi:hypothetical protein